MLVFKRAVCFVLATLLVVPTSALARANNATNTSKRGVASKAVPRAVASVPFAKATEPKYMTSGEALSTLMPKKLGGKNAGYEVFQEKGKGKFLKSRTVKKGDFTEILVDNDEDGTADIWEVTRGSMTMKASRPYMGRFTRIQYTDRREKAEIKTTLQLKPDFSDYRVVSTNILPYKQMNSGGVQTEMCPTSRNEISSFEEILRQITANTEGSKEDGIRCKANRYQDFLIDPSCKSNDAMLNSMDSILGGFADVAGSNGSTTPPKLLQCLENHGYGYHSAKIQERLSGHFTQNWRLKRFAGWSEAQLQDNSCEPLNGNAPTYDANGLATGNTTPIAPMLAGPKPLKPLIRCEHSTDPNERRDGTWLRDQIILRKSAAQLQKPGVSAKDAYASLIFHELIHSSGVTGSEEELIENMQKCCAVTGASASDKNVACGAIDSRHEQERVITRMSMSIGFNTLQGDLQDVFGTEGSEVFTDRWISGLRTDPGAASAIEEFERCDSAAPGSMACRNTVINKLKLYSDGFVDRECPAFKQTSPTGSKASCTKVKSEITRVLTAPQVEILDPMPVVSIDSTPLESLRIPLTASVAEVMPQTSAPTTCPQQSGWFGSVNRLFGRGCPPATENGMNQLAGGGSMREDAEAIERDRALQRVAESGTQRDDNSARDAAMAAAAERTRLQANSRTSGAATHPFDDGSETSTNAPSRVAQPPRPNIPTGSLNPPPLNPTVRTGEIENGGALPPAAPAPATRAPIVVTVPPRATTAPAPGSRVATAPPAERAPIAAAPTAPTTNAPAAQPTAGETGGSLVFGGPISQPAPARPTLGTSAPAAPRPVTVYREPAPTRDSNTNGGTIARTNPNSYQPPLQPSVNPYTSPRPMPVAGSSAPIGEGDRSLSAATPVTNALLNIGEGISNQVIGALSVPTANASVVSARAMVALPERNLASYQPPAPSSSGGSRASGSSARGGSSGGSSSAGRGDGPSSSGGSSAGRSALAPSGAGTSDRSAGEDSQEDPANSAAGEPRVASAERAPAEREDGDRPVAASARAANVRGWNQNTFRSTTDARIFLTRTSVTEVESLMRQPAFVDDLVRRRIGIRRNNGRFVGHSQPEIVYVECGSKLVLRGLCR